MDDKLLTLYAKNLAWRSTKTILEFQCIVCSEWADYHHQRACRAQRLDRRIAEQRNAAVYASNALQYRLALLFVTKDHQ